MVISAFDHSKTDAATKPSVKRPPGAISEEEFTYLCVQCGDCAAVCPSQVIEMDGAGFPVVSVSDSCGDCGLCADVCSHSCIELTDLTKAGLERVMAEERRLFCV